MRPDPKNSQTFTSMLVAKSQATNNTASVGLDTKGYVGAIALRVNVGVKTVGDNDGTVTVIVQSSADNAGTNATNLASTANVATTNNTAASGTILVDTQNPLLARYLFARVVLTGTNSPAYPVAVEAVGVKQVQP